MDVRGASYVMDERNNLVSKENKFVSSKSSFDHLYHGISFEGPKCVCLGFYTMALK